MQRVKREQSSGTLSFFYHLGGGLGAALLWTAIGCAIAFAQGDVGHFLAEWTALQGPFLVGFGTWLMLIAWSDTLSRLAKKLGSQNANSAVRLPVRWLRWFLIFSITIFGTTSLVEMGFDATGTSLWFMWVTCAAICTAAGYLTLHAVDILFIVHRLEKGGINVFSYAPARTPEFREIIGYFTTFTAILSVGYAFAFVATLRGHWTGNKQYIEIIQWFWPVVYVPICSLALVYPHVVLHNLVQRAKERILNSYQIQIDRLLTEYQGLKVDDVQRVNNLAQLFDRISATPNYVIDLGVAFRTVIPFAFNLAILFAKPALGLS